jgi:hypothetical protein
MEPPSSSPLHFSSPESPLSSGQLDPQISTLTPSLLLKILTHVSLPCVGSYQKALHLGWRGRLKLVSAPSGPQSLPRSALACSGSLGQLAFVPVEHGNSFGEREEHPSWSHLSHLAWFPFCTQRCLGTDTRISGPFCQALPLNTMAWWLGMLEKLKEETMGMGTRRLCDLGLIPCPF